jgi:hypothetical protein
LDELRFEIPEPFPLNKELTIELRFEIPETLRLVRTPTDVMLSWAGSTTEFDVETVPVIELG